MASAAVGERRSLLAPDAERWPADPGRPVLHLAQVRKSFGEIEVIRGLDLEIPTGETTVIIGRSGSGKTVLIKLMAGLLRADTGEVRLFGEDLTTVSDRRLLALRRRVAVVFQNYALFDSLSVEGNVGFPLRENSRLKEAEVRERVAHLLRLLDLSDAADKMPSEISGGMRKRVSFARAVVTQPEVVLFDEPTTGLDPVMVAFVDDMISRTREAFGITSVVISHDMASVFRLAQHIAVLEGGRIVERGTPDEIRASGDATVRAFLDAGSATVDRRPAGATQIEAPAVEFREVRKGFGGKEVLRGVTFSVLPGEITVVIGASGSGKSVIIKHMMGLLAADSGEALVLGQDVAACSEAELRALRRRIGMVFQQSALLDFLTVKGNVAFPLAERREMPTKQIEETVAALLERLRLSDVADRYPGDLSAGHRKRVALARALITQPELMIYDEPTTGQDPVLMGTVDDMIVEANRDFGITSVVISHDMESTRRIAHQVAMLHEGRILAFGPPESLFSSTVPEVAAFVRAGQPSAG